LVWETANWHFKRMVGFMQRESTGDDGPSKPITALAFSPDGQVLATGDEDGRVWYWASKNGLPLKYSTKHEGAVTSVVFQRNEGLVASSAADQTVKLSDPESPLTKTVTVVGHRGPVDGVGFVGNNIIVSISNFDRTIRFWNRDTNSWVMVSHFPPNTCCSSLAHNGTAFVLADQAGHLRLWALPLVPEEEK